MIDLLFRALAVLNLAASVGGADPPIAPSPPALHQPAPCSNLPAALRGRLPPTHPCHLENPS